MIFLTIFLFFVALSDARNSSRIIGGQPVNVGAYPYMVAITKTTADGTFFCGGVLKDRQWIITAGHCVDGAISFTLRLGVTHLNIEEETSLTVTTETYFLHPDYNPQTLDNDIGLIKMRMPITKTDYISPVPLISAEELIPPSSVIALGWGQTDDENPGLVDTLQYVHLTPLLNEECKVTYGDQITDNMVCLVGNYNEGFCNGDSGGPLIQYLFTTWYMLVGIASFVSANGCESTDPSGYTRINPYNSWMYEVISAN